MAFAKVTLLGNLGKDPEDFKYSGRNGDQTGAKFSLAVSTGKDDKRTTDWFNCTCFGSTAKIAKDWLTKGKSVIIMGKLSLRNWENKEGKTISNMEVNVDSIEFVPNGDGAKGSNGAPTAVAAPAGSTRTSAPAADPNDDDCPF